MQNTVRGGAVIHELYVVNHLYVPRKRFLASHHSTGSNELASRRTRKNKDQLLEFCTCINSRRLAEE